MPEIRCGEGKPRNRAGRADFRPRRLRRAISAQGRCPRRRQRLAWFRQRSAAARRYPQSAALAGAAATGRAAADLFEQLSRQQLFQRRRAPARLRRAVIGSDLAVRARCRAGGGRDRSAGRRHARLPAAGGPLSLSECAVLSAARAQSCAVFRAAGHAAAAGARAFARQSRRLCRPGRDQADGDAGMSDRLNARPLVCRIPCSPPRSAGSVRASPRSSRSPPIPAAA